MVNKRDDGFTLTEALIAMALFAILITAVVAPLTSLFRVQRDSNSTLSATTSAQSTLEAIRDNWTPQTYGQNLDTDPAVTAYTAASTGVTIPSGLTYTCRNLDNNGADTAPCSGNETPQPAARRIRLQKTNAQNVVDVDVFLDIISPSTR
ncbi:type IV pilus modification PilV family protein [Deinococcus maricopensis]|uniref:Pilin, type IV n=1 Tax=Deinococcus maricopensis (strain DSM 21211 / LMG 22137 / NRRL B-23946 / LB-34) TaxID=709986 RepID=E8UB11_DEIML|nr:type II secretion system protein [Deinococcus maricopensis]ADV68250.1 hypothetical protein Deima_2617 [Deinococcus maricopensis DSM 21211]